MAKLNCSRRTFLKGAAVTGVALGAFSGGSVSALAETEQSEPGAITKIRSTCRACGKMECGTWVWVQDGKVIDITGDESAISSRGNICAKGKSATQALYHPARIYFPMKRTNPKGEDPGWVRITWDEALDAAAEGFKEIVDKYGGPAIRSLHGTSRLTSYAVMMFCYYVGSPNGGCTAGQVCKGPRTSTGAMTCFPAHWTSLNDGVDFFVQWGTNQEVSNYDNANRVLVDAQVGARKSACIGPRLQNLGKEADLKVHLRPGTDDAFAAGVLNLIINEMKSYDEMFVKKWSNGPFLYVADLEPSGFVYSASHENGVYPLDIRTRLLKQSDVVEGGDPQKFMVWDKKNGRLTYFDVATALWEGETEYVKPTEFEKWGEGYLVHDNGFQIDIDPAIDNEVYEITLKDGSVVKAETVMKKLGESVAEWTSEKTAEHCWITPEVITEFAEEFAGDLMRGGLQYNLPLEHAGNAVQSTRMPLIMSGLTDNVDTPGGNRGGECSYFLYGFFHNYATPFGVAPQAPELRAKVAGGDKYPLIPYFQTIAGAAFNHDHTSASRMMLTGEPYPIRAQISCTGNHFHSGNATENWEAYKTLDFYWAAELWHSPVSELADIVVPTCHFLEVETMRVSQGGEYGIGLQAKCVEPGGEARWDSEQVVEITKRMGIPWWPVAKEAAPPWWPEEWLEIQWPNAQQMNEMAVIGNVQGTTAPGPEGDRLECSGWDDFKQQYQDNGQWDMRKVSPIGYYRRHLLGYMRTDGLPGWDTPTTKFELWSTILESYHPGEELPLVREPKISPYSREDMVDEYPLVVTSGKRNPMYFHSEGRQQPYLREQAPTPVFQINPATAEELGIEQGDWCWIETPSGKIRQVADLFYGIDPRVIECEHAWWYPELPAPTHGWNLSNVNALVDSDLGCPVTGAANLRAYLGKVYKATPENSPYGNPVPCADEDGTPVIQSASDPRLKDWMPIDHSEVK